MKVSSDAKTPQEAVRDIETLITSAINREKSKLNHCVTKKQEQMGIRMDSKPEGIITLNQ